MTKAKQGQLADSNPTWTPQQGRQHNRSVVLREVVRHGKISRRQIALNTGLTEASVSRIVRELVDLGLLEETGESRQAGRRGRAHVEVSLRAEGGYVIGVCLSAFAKEIAIANLKGEKLACIDIPDSLTASPQRTMQYVADHIRKLIKQAHRKKQKVFGVGISVAGIVDHEAQTVEHAPLLGWNNIPLVDLLGDQRSYLAVVENIANSLCLAHLHNNSLYSHPNLYLVHVAVSMGASLVIHDRIIRGCGDESAINHVPVDGTKVLCECGHRGCLTTVSSGAAILRVLGNEEIKTGLKSGKANALKQVISESNLGDTTVEDALFHGGYCLGKALVPLTAAFEPQQIVIAGPVASATSYFSGVCSGFTEAFRGNTPPSNLLAVNDMSYIDAALALALQQFVFSERADVLAS